MLTPAEVSLLVEVGFWALDEKLYDDAEVVFSRLSTVQASNPYPRIGLAMLAYSRGQGDEAIQQLHGLLGDFPNAVFTRSLLARFMKERNEPGWERYARETLERVQSGAAADLARTLLNDAAAAATRDTSSRPSDSLSATMTMRRV